MLRTVLNKQRHSLMVVKDKGPSCPLFQVTHHTVTNIKTQEPLKLATSDDSTKNYDMIKEFMHFCYHWFHHKFLPACTPPNTRKM